MHWRVLRVRWYARREGALCGLQRAVDVGSRGVWDVGENFSVGGVDDVEGFTVFVRTKPTGCQ